MQYDGNPHQATRLRRVAVGGVSVLAAAGLTLLATDGSVRFGRRSVTPRVSVEIYPTADRVPENLLRVYVVFDRAMAAGESRRHLHLVDEWGRQTPNVFLFLEEELWDPTGRRLTVLFDPGRIKRGLRANVEDGPPLSAGRRYRLVVEAGWRDASGRPLGNEVSRTYLVTPADRQPPSVERWLVTTPLAGSRVPVRVDFPEPLDRALLSSALDVSAPDGRRVPGAVDVTLGERTWLFTPAQPWTSGTYQLEISTVLEDVAGNSLRRVFDADLLRAPAETAVPPVVSRPFRVVSGT
jgi:Bacterial Ig-like domain